MLKTFQMVYSQAGQLLFGDGQSLTGHVSSQGERDFQPAENQDGVSDFRRLA
jgi:hypothetical protein